MNKGNILIILFLIIAQSAFAQSFTSIRDWPMPEGDKQGLVNPGFKIVPRFGLLHIVSELHVTLKMDVTMSTAQNPIAPFSYRYLVHDKVYTDQDLGPQAFYPIRLLGAIFSVRVLGANNYNKQVEYPTVQGGIDLGVFPKGTKPEEFTAHIEALTQISYDGTEIIRKAILARELEVKAKEENEKKAAAEKQAKNTQTAGASREPDLKAKTANGQKPFTEKPLANTRPQNNDSPKATTPAAKPDDGFWSDRSTSKGTGPGTVVPEQAMHKNLPDFVRTTDGGYFHRGADGKFREVTAQEYQQAKNAASASSRTQQQPEQQKVTSEAVRASVNKMFSDAQARNDAVNQRIEQHFQMWQQNFYYAEAIRSGKANLAGLSRLEGSYSSVEELESAFNQQYSAIRSEVNNLEQARNAQLSNAVTNTFNGNSTERSIGQGVQLIGNMINSAQAAKEARKAEAALNAARERQLAAIAAAKKKARLDLRSKLVESFPDGSTPISSHKVTLPEVYMFAYITDKASFNSDQATVVVSDVFPVTQYSDGTFPYKTTVANRLKGYAPGDVVLVGYYGDKAWAEQMRGSFINLAAKSELGVKTFALKTTQVSSASKSAGGGDFWETGKKTITSDTTKTEKKSDFWNN